MTKPLKSNTENLKSNSQPKPAHGELSEQDLDKVSGGASNTMKTISTTSDTITSNQK